MSKEKEIWKVDHKKEVITPEMLKSNPDKYGGLGMHMKISIQKGIVTLPLISLTGMVVSIPVTAEAAERILKDGEIEIESDGYWINIASNDIKRFFKGSTEEIPILTTFLSEPVKK